MPLWSNNKPPRFASDSIQTPSGWEDPKTNELIVAFGDLNAKFDYVTRGLEAQYRMSAVGLPDDSENALNGTLLDPAPQKYKNFYRYTGPEAIQLPDELLGNDDTSVIEWTLEAWVRMNGPQPEEETSVISFGEHSVGINIRWNSSGGYRFHAMHEGEYNNYVVGTDQIISGRWYDVTATFSSIGTLSLYIDGVKVAEDESVVIGGAANPALLGQGGKYLGYDVDYDLSSFNGSLGLVRVYSVCLTPQEVASNFNNCHLYENARPAPIVKGVVVSVDEPNSALAVEWSAASDPTSIYNVYRATTSGGPYTLMRTVVDNSYTDQTVVSSTQYYYIVTASSLSRKESAVSTEVSAIAPALGPPIEVATYLMNEGSGLTLNDSSGNDLDGTLTMGTLSTYPAWANSPTRLSFIGRTERVQVPTIYADVPPRGLSLEAWVKVGTIPGLISYFMYLGSRYTLGAHLAFNIPTSQFKGGLEGSQMQGVATSDVVATPNQWHHVVSSTQRSGDTYVNQMYVDGVASGPQHVFVATIPSGFEFNASGSIGGLSGVGAPFIGELGFARMWDKVLIPSDVLTAFNATKTKFGL
jgi:hypothetical protein